MITQRHYDILKIMARAPASVRSMVESLGLRKTGDSNIRYNFARLIEMQAIEVHQHRTTHPGTTRQTGPVYTITKRGYQLIYEFDNPCDVVKQQFAANPNRINIFALPVYRPALHNSSRQGVAYI